MIRVTLHRPWLQAELPEVMPILSHAPYGGGLTQSRHILWLEVRNTDLPPDFPAEDWLGSEVQGTPFGARAGAVAMLTSRDVSQWAEAQAEVEGIHAHAVVTLGLSNAESVGRRLPWHSADFGTINLLVATDAALTDMARLEALTIAVQARTAAVIEMGWPLATGIATGTGTDCTALASPSGPLRYAGLHTALGEAIGAAARAAVTRACGEWRIWREAAASRHPR